MGIINGYKLASCHWNWMKTPEELPKKGEAFPILDEIRGIGFEEFDINGTDQSLNEYWDEAEAKAVGDYGRSIGLAPNVFVHHTEVKWSEKDPDIMKRQLANFKRATEIANAMGSKIISTLAQRPYTATPWRLNPRACAQKEAFHLPDDYDFEADWNRLATTYRKLSRMATDAGLKFAIEGHVWSMVSNPHAMRNMIKDVNEKNFGIQLDTNHLIAQRIDPEWTIHMIGGARIYNVHCKDNDMYSRGNIPAGCGITDYTEVIRALKAVEYHGNLTVELEFTDMPTRYNRQAYEHIVKCLKGEY